MDNPYLSQVYEFRPLPKILGGHRTVLRYAEGEWIPDDGETYDLAFGYGNFCLYVDLPYYSNLTWKWLTRPWTSDEPNHPNQNPWHYAYRSGMTDRGERWDRDSHLNEKAGREGMRFLSSKYGAANGQGVEFDLSDHHFLAGLVRTRDTGEIVVPPISPACGNCDLAWMEAKQIWRHGGAIPWPPEKLPMPEDLDAFVRPDNG